MHEHGFPFAPLVCTQVPTVSEWGLVVLTLLLLTGIVIKFGRRQAVTA